MDDLRLVTRGGFINVFWEELRRRRSADRNVTQRDVYEELDAHREEVYGEPLFPSFDAFRVYRDSFSRKKFNKRRNLHSKPNK
ncbi:MAG: hypothetical protein IJ363_14095 [Clostridia bacterium]|jgi:hypothetical protein|nr:hypothetical protein [Clostridia bacterium]